MWIKNTEGYHAFKYFFIDKDSPYNLFGKAILFIPMSLMCFLALGIRKVK